MYFLSNLNKNIYTPSFYLNIHLILHQIFTLSLNEYLNTYTPHIHIYIYNQ